MHSKPSFGWGGILISLSAAIYLQQRPAWAAIHPHIAQGIYLLTVIVVLFSVIQFRWFQRLFDLQPIERKSDGASSKTKATEKSAAAGRDIGKANSDNVSIGGHVFGDDAIKVLTRSSTNAAPLPSEPKRLPRIELAWASPVPLVEIWDRSIQFSERDGNGLRSCVITVHNLSADPGERAVRADSLSAHITFKHGASRITNVDRCCWIGHSENEIYISP